MIYSLKRLWLVLKYVFGFSNNFARKDIYNIKLFRYEVEYTRQVLIAAIIAIVLFIGIVSLTVNVLSQFTITAFIVCIVELVCFLFLFDNVLYTIKIKLQKKYDFYDGDD